MKVIDYFVDVLVKLIVFLLKIEDSVLENSLFSIQFFIVFFHLIAFSDNCIHIVLQISELAQKSFLIMLESISSENESFPFPF